MIDTWKQLIETRAQTASWDLDYDIPLETIQEISQEIHRRAPSKQNRVRYSMHWFNWSNTALRNNFYEFAVDRDNPNPQWNSQLLANWLVVFVGRTPGEFDLDFSNKRGRYDEALSNIEVGLAAHMLIHGATARGLDCGFCKCFDLDYKHHGAINQALNIEKSTRILLTLGVGKERADDITTTLNLHTGEMVNSINEKGHKWYREPKPLLEEYIFYNV